MRCVSCTKRIAHEAREGFLILQYCEPHLDTIGEGVTYVGEGELVQKTIDAGHTDCDFGILLELQAAASSMQLSPENVEVEDGLS